jgi:ribonuclease P protein component
VKSRFCLTSSTDFKRVRRFGKSYAHPLVVLVVHSNQLEVTRFGVTAGRSLGGAVQRNRAKRRLRTAQQVYLGKLPNGWDLIWIAREPLLRAPFTEVQTAMAGLLKRAGLLDKSYVFAFPSSTGAA